MQHDQAPLLPPFQRVRHHHLKGVTVGVRNLAVLVNADDRSHHYQIRQEGLLYEGPRLARSRADNVDAFLFEPLGRI